MSNHPGFLIPLIYLLVSIPYAALGLYAWRRRPAVGIVPFVWMVLGMATWSFAYALEIYFPVLPAKLFLVKIEYLGVVSIPVSLLFFALEYTGRSDVLTARSKALIWGIPALIILLTWTNEFHHLMWASEKITENFGLSLLSISPSFFYWVTFGYSYILIFIGSLLLIMEFIQHPGIYRAQISLVIISILSPWLGNVFNLFGMSPIPNLDITPLFFIPTVFGLAWAILRYRLLDVFPVEHLTILQNMRDGVIVLDSHQRAVYLNPIAEYVFQRPETIKIGQPVNTIFSACGKNLTTYLTGKEEQFEISISKSGRRATFEVTVSPIVLAENIGSSQHPGYIIILHDITLRKEAEAILGRREAILEAIGLAAEQFLKESSWEHNIPVVLERIGQAADVSRVYVFMNYSDEKGVIHSSQCYEWAAPGVKPQIDNPAMQHIPLRQAGFSRWEDALKNEQPVHGLLRELPESEQKILQDQGILSLAIMPIFVDRQWWGFIGFDECRCERAWTSIELGALQAAANIFGSAETRARVEQKLLRRQNTLNLLHEIVIHSLQASDLSSMAQVLVDRLGKLINADGCFLSLWDETHQQTIPLAAYGPFKDIFLTIQPAPGDTTLTLSALKAGHTLLIADVQNSVYIDQRTIEKFPSRSVIVLPLIAGSKRLGSIILAFDLLRRFQPEEITVSEQAANLIALSLEKFQAVQHALRRADDSETLRRASVAVTETLQADDAIVRILEQLEQVIPYDSASVQLLDGNELLIVGGRGWENLSDVVGTRFPIPGDNPNTVVIQTAKPYLLPEADKTYAAFNNPPHSHIRSWLGVPLIVQERIIGLLAIDSAEPNHFTSNNINLATAFADQVAVALENTRLFTESKTQAITDSLTNIYNRRGLFQVGEFEFVRARRMQRSYSAIMLDIDHFKRVNDHYGHAAGDQALRVLAERCQKGLRSVDIVGRYGGEEFMILLPESNLDTACLVAERVRQSMVNEPFPTDAGPMRLTISVGVTEAKDSDTFQSLMERADLAMYEAKNSGRNRVATVK
jgi:diguanylate cyclase (GGDEF)-like protein/PAS domain S-box-containing protein